MYMTIRTKQKDKMIAHINLKIKLSLVSETINPNKEKKNSKRINNGLSIIFLIMFLAFAFLITPYTTSFIMGNYNIINIIILH